MKKKYILDNIANGLDIDWKKIFKMYINIVKNVMKKYELVEDSFYIPTPPLDSARWFVECSERSVGKTTCYLLIGLLLFREYKDEQGEPLKFEYIRLSKDGIMPKNASDLFKVILKYGYLQEVFGDKWNTVIQKPRSWYLAKADANGTILEVDKHELCHMHCLQTKEVDSEKSVYNSDAVWIIVDEFIPVDGVTTEQQFLNLMQLHSTIRRQRLDIKCVLLANIVNKYTHFFQELMISDTVTKMKMGEETIVTSPKGVPVWVHLIKLSNEVVAQKRIENNLSFYGFENPKLNAIIGGEEWETKNYPHLSQYLSREDEKKQIQGNVYIKFQGKMMKWELWQSKKLGFFALVRPYFDEPKDDAIIYTLEQPKKKNEVYGIGLGSTLDRLVLNMANQHQTFFSSNEMGALFDAYYKTVRATPKII